MEQAAASLEVSARQMWTFYKDVGRAEILLAMETSHTHQFPIISSSQRDVEESRQSTCGMTGEEGSHVASEDVLDEWEIIDKPDISCLEVGVADEGMVGVAEGGKVDVTNGDEAGVANGNDLESERVLSRDTVSELLSDLVVAAVVEAEFKYLEQVKKVETMESQEGLQSRDVLGGCGLSDDVTIEVKGSIVEDIQDIEGTSKSAVHDSSSSVEFERKLASCLVEQLKREWAVVMATQAQTKYWEVVGKKTSNNEEGGGDALCLEGELTNDGCSVCLRSHDEADDTDTLNLAGELSEHDEINGRHDDTARKDDAISGRGQHKDSPICDETDNRIIGDSHLDEDVVEGKRLEDSLKLVLSSSVLNASAIAPVMCDAETNTSAVLPIVCDNETNTVSVPLVDRANSPAPPPPIMSHAHTQTVLSIEDLETRVKEKEELELLKVDLHVVRGNLNQEKSQRLVAEELIKIIQSDLNATSSRNTGETMARLQAENELIEVKGELSHCKRELKEKEERIEELEDTLKGTSLMVRKMEEQNAATLINRGGIDYMLQARLADGRAKEAEQKLQVLQTELLQSQSEVRMLLDRVSESSRNRAEMVSSKIHNQLMSIADEKAAASERCAQMMEREILELRRRLAAIEGRDGGGHTGLTGLTSSGLTGYASSTMLGGGLTGLGSGGLGSGLGGLGSGLGGMGTGLGGMGYGFGGVGSGLGGLGSRFDGLGSGLGMGSGLSGMGAGLGGSMGYGSALGGMGVGSSTLESSIGMGYGLTGMNSGLSGMGTGLSSTTTGLTSAQSGLTGLTGLGSSSTAVTSNMESLEKTSVSYSLAPYGTASAFTSSADGGSGHKSHDGGMKSHDYKLGKTSFDSKESTDGGFTLPSFDTPSGIQSDGMPIPRMKQLSGSRGDGSDGDSDSSDWSSSGDEGDGLSADMKPTSHAALISEWEWRVMKEEGGNAQPITSSPQLSRKRPPPVAPKPVVFRMVTASGEVHYTVEPPSSFDEPSHGAILLSQQLQKPRGPAGRKVPLRWRQQQQHQLLFT